MYMYDNVIYGVDQNHQLNCLTNKYRGLKSFCKVKDTSKVKMTEKKFQKAKMELTCKTLVIL